MRKLLIATFDCDVTLLSTAADARYAGRWEIITQICDVYEFPSQGTTAVQGPVANVMQVIAAMQAAGHYLLLSVLPVEGGVA